MHRTSNDTRTTRPVAVPIAALALAGLLLGGCSSAPTATTSRGPAPRTTPATPRSSSPGRPGEEAETVGPDDVPEAADWNHSDVAFVQMMVPHHAQALEMSALAPQRAASPRVKALARRIKGAQGPEVLTLSSWLQTRDIEVPQAGEDPATYDHGEHGHMEMEGMLTQAGDGAAEGGERHPLRPALPARHDRPPPGRRGHGRAVAVDGTDLQVSEIAADVTAGQAGRDQPDARPAALPLSRPPRGAQ